MLPVVDDFTGRTVNNDVWKITGRTFNCICILEISYRRQPPLLNRKSGLSVAFGIRRWHSISVNHSKTTLQASLHWVDFEDIWSKSQRKILARVKATYCGNFLKSLPWKFQIQFGVWSPWATSVPLLIRIIII